MIRGVRKEVIIAIVGGFILGLLITFGIWTTNKALKPQTTEPLITTITETPSAPSLSTSPSPAPLSLTVISPENNALFSQEKITVSGKTNPEAMVAILYSGGEKIVQADADGNFSEEVSLNAGGNEITVTAFDGSGNEATVMINVSYSTAEI